MTSPAITKSPENQKAGEKKSPTHSARAPSRAESTNSQTAAGAASTAAEPLSRECPMPIGWLRVFKFADLMMKQGC